MNKGKNKQRVYVDLDVADALGSKAREVGVDVVVLLDVILRSQLKEELIELKGNKDARKKKG